MKTLLMISMLLFLSCRAALLNTKIRYFPDEKSEKAFIQELKAKKYEYWVTPLDHGVFEVNYIEKAKPAEE